MEIKMTPIPIHRITMAPIPMEKLEFIPVVGYGPFSPNVLVLPEVPVSLIEGQLYVILNQPN
jgi:hypothetical protein